MIKDGWLGRLDDIKTMKNIIRPVEQKGRLTDGNGKAIKIYTHEIIEYLGQPYLFLIDFWYKYKKLGSPWLSGWSEWPHWAVLTIMAIEEIKDILNGNS